MAIPALRYIEYLVLGVLMEGPVPGRSLRTILREEFDYKDADKKPFFHLIGSMSKSGLIVINKEVTTTTKRTRQESCYAVSDLGKAQWKYTYSFFSTFCDRWKEFADQVPTVELPLERVYPKDQVRRTARLPNAHEITLILKEAQPEFAVLFDLSMTLAQCMIVLSRLDVTDVDKHASTLRMRHGPAGDEQIQIIEIPRRCREGIAMAIAGRSQGPLFLNAMGTAWTAENVRMCWRRLKEKLKLDSGVVLPSTRFLKSPVSSPGA